VSFRIFKHHSPAAPSAACHARTEAAYCVRSEQDPITGDYRCRIIILYADGRIDTLPPQFRDESALEEYIERWKPNLVGKRTQLLEVVARHREARRILAAEDPEH
jgi:hypothetical protein